MGRTMNKETFELFINNNKGSEVIVTSFDNKIDDARDDDVIYSVATYFKSRNRYRAMTQAEIAVADVDYNMTVASLKKDGTIPVCIQQNYAQSNRYFKIKQSFTNGWSFGYPVHTNNATHMTLNNKIGFSIDMSVASMLDLLNNSFLTIHMGEIQDNLLFIPDSRGKCRVYTAESLLRANQ